MVKESIWLELAEEDILWAEASLKEMAKEAVGQAEKIVDFVKSKILKSVKI